MKRDEWRLVAIAAVSGICQVIALLALLWLTHKNVQSHDYATASVTALVFLALVIEWAGGDR